MGCRNVRGEPLGGPPRDFRSWTGGYRDEANYVWTSPDLRSSYTLKFPYINPHLRQSRRDFSITRTECFDSTESLPQSTPVSCEETEWEAENPQETARQLQKERDAEDLQSPNDLRSAAWRFVERRAEVGGIELSSHLVLKECLEHEMDEDEYGYCHWVSKDGLQAVSASLTRNGFLRNDNRPKSLTVRAPTAFHLTECRPD